MGIGSWVVCALCVPLVSCSLLFDRSAEPGPETVPCVGSQRCFGLGDPVPGDATRFEFLDYGQGTITFWAAAQKDFEVDTELVNLGGIRIVANSDGTVAAFLPVDGGEVTVATDASESVDWENDGDVFIALRWDTKRPVSGDQDGNFHAMLRVDLEFEGGVQGTFAVAPVNNAGLVVGDSKGVFAVDQLVVYGRPLHVEDNRAQGDALGVMSFMKTASAQLALGGVDVSFATSAPFYGDCVDCAPLAWSMPLRSEVEGHVRSGGTGISWRTEPLDAPDTELVFSSAVAVRDIDAEADFDIKLESGHSYSFYGLSHSTGGASARLRVNVLTAATEPGPILLDAYASASSSVDMPHETLATFQMPEGSTFARVSLSKVNGVAGDMAVFHTIVIRENFFENASFETPGADAEIFESWQLRADPTVASATLNLQNSGLQSVCFGGVGVRSDAHQGFDEELMNEEFYAIGAMFLRGATDQAVEPGVNAGNSGFFGTGKSHEQGERARAASLTRQRWSPAGVVSYRLRSPEANATNDEVYLGGLSSQPSDVLDHCVDDAYFYPVTKLEGRSGE